MGNEEKELMVTIPLSRYEELVDLETRATLLMEHTQRQVYCIERENVAHYLNFSLRRNKPCAPASAPEGSAGKGDL